MSYKILAYTNVTFDKAEYGLKMTDMSRSTAHSMLGNGRNGGSVSKYAFAINVLDVLTMYGVRYGKMSMEGAYFSSETLPETKLLSVKQISQMDSQLIEIYRKNKRVQVSCTEHKLQNSIEANDKHPQNHQ